MPVVSYNTPAPKASPSNAPPARRQKRVQTLGLRHVLMVPPTPSSPTASESRVLMGSYSRLTTSEPLTDEPLTQFPGSEEAEVIDLPHPVVTEEVPEVVDLPPIPAPKLSFWQAERLALVKVFSSWLNCLLIFVPFAFLSKALHASSPLLFTCSYLAMLPLPGILGRCTEMVARRTNALVGGIVNAFIAGSVMLIIIFQAVVTGKFRIVQGCLLGSILGNMLLGLGLSCTSAGLFIPVAKFDAFAASAHMTCQVVASISILLPTMYQDLSGTTETQVLLLSRICSIFLSLFYIAVLYFQLCTHAHLYQDPAVRDAVDQEPRLSIVTTLGLIGAILSIALRLSLFLMASIDDIAWEWRLSHGFIGVVLLPIAGNIAEHMATLTSAANGRIDIAVAVTVGSSLQTTLFVVPCTVLLGWSLDKPVTLGFDNFQAGCMMLSVMLVSQVLAQGSSSWFQGAILLVTYAIFVTFAWFLPEKPW